MKINFRRDPPEDRVRGTWKGRVVRDSDIIKMDKLEYDRFMIGEWMSVLDNKVATDLDKLNKRLNNY